MEATTKMMYITCKKKKKLDLGRLSPLGPPPRSIPKEYNNKLTLVTAPGNTNVCIMRSYLVYQISSRHHPKDASKVEGKKGRGSGV